MINKKTLIDFVANEMDCTKALATSAVNAVLDGIANSLINDKEDVQLIGFGTFELRNRAERQGKNPQTGESITIPASTTVGFKPSKAIKEAINK